MDVIMVIAVGVGGGIFGLIAGYVIRYAQTAGKRGSVELEVKQILLSGKEEAQKIIQESEKKAERHAGELRAQEKEKEREWKKTEERLVKKEELLDKRQGDIDKEVENIKGKAEEVRTIKGEVEERKHAVEVELERVAGLSEEEAKQALVKKIEERFEEDFRVRLQKLEREGVERLDRRAKDILSTSIQRLAASTAGDIMTTSVTIPNDEIKGKIIGKEGRNIRTFERVAGVELIVDDTPGTIVISGFDPVRRQIARVALENLILDGRIQPSKIEETVEKAKTDINKIIKEKGEQACYECGVINMDPRLISILGRLYFRTSYGQNVLQHSIEMAHISAMLAEELGADIPIARAGALFHDIGKALDHEVQGTHVEIGRRILQKFGADERIVKAMQSHHEEYPYETIESIIVQTADAISGGRPGARRESVENYIKKLEDLERIASSRAGVEKAYALQAGREVRVFVTPQAIGDLEAHALARDIAMQIEQELKYPGEIKITVIREMRCIEYAR
ncbi:MAG: ribonuclease Y [Candidatus Lloydbacteria bacterium RIFCSPLOWO2_01_FULL_50_20]|uniref:Ribonuclease Y n=1 Tax=Candidatus Lloydbacteria bacterium RIFCSPLOWO2_01_FULL_50_20 TaxID=1798665 RepID=A0A1G2DDV7_9BACT|nr:MAG: ribonuclease Y [Candidatus Lloydbacteria bacterium RIFCSPHIGHO2_02_FULL_50_11]OGZ11827.1 MAG: ribonuclease Y [Candidatus Lloydbacteria bacterium RIFCSPLOWO2_01_FULL_50_20]